MLRGLGRQHRQRARAGVRLQLRRPEGTPHHLHPLIHLSHPTPPLDEWRGRTVDPAAGSHRPQGRRAAVPAEQPFTTSGPNAKYVRDITHLPLEGGKFLYLATVIDRAWRRLADRAIADRMRTDLSTDALHAAERTRGSLAGAVMHTDQLNSPNTSVGPSPMPAAWPASASR
ncbi:DDE-type integrase/transposase/recombinase [Streptomyces sp. NPDC050549]|uniref:DDE-type integrase/transposase/recombinase n=1 Tax=Streptomyces sp. NPDC050549 TaxID=3155406 RepID=UPI0034302CDD